MSCRRLTVLGAGESGLGVALLAKQKGFEVFVSQDTMLSVPAKNLLQQHQIPFEAKHSDRATQADRVVKSPGIPNTAEVISWFESKSISIESEISFAYPFIEKTKIIGVTGTNGKTTTTLLIAHMLQNLGYNAMAVGNMGYSFCRALYEKKPIDYYVLELSSFQLEYVGDFRCDIAVLLNIQLDHLDRYDDVNSYAAAKMQIAKNQQRHDAFIYNGADPMIRRYRQNSDILAQQKDFSAQKYEKYPEELRHIYPDSIRVAMAISEHLGLSEKKVFDALVSFQLPPHRMQFVRTWKGITFINDSKATNVSAARHALHGLLSSNIIWIVGGKPKGAIDFSPLIPIPDNVKAVYFHTQDERSLCEAFGEALPQEKFRGNFLGMNHLIGAISRFATEGDMVLFSPALASFDLYRNFEHRGDVFCKAVLDLK